MIYEYVVMNINCVATKEVADSVRCEGPVWHVRMFYNLWHLDNQSQFWAAKTAAEVGATTRSS